LRLVPLGKLGDFKNGVNFKGNLMGRGVPLVNVKDITASHRIDPLALDLMDVQANEDLIASTDDIFFVRSSVKLDGIALVGRLTSNEPQAIHCGFVIRLRPKSPRVSADYLVYLLLSPEYRQRLKGLSGGAAIVNISQTNLKSLPVLLPPLGVQRRIAAILSAYDDLIENNNRRMKLLEESALLLYQEWFVRLRFPGYEHTRAVEGVPEGWEKKVLSTIADVNKETLKSSFDGEIEYIDISSVTTGQINETTFYDFREAPSRARRIVRHGDIIWSCVRPNRRSYAVIWQPPPNLIASTGFAVLTPAGVPTSFLYFATTTDAFVGYLANHARGAAYPAVIAGDFERAEILIPPKGVLNAFNDVVEPTFSQINNLATQNQKLKAARDLLLPRLMSGEIGV
jgi:type I restriction enzyme S subunit